MIRRALRQAMAVAGLALLPALVSGAIQLRAEKVEPLAAGEVRAGTARQWGVSAQFVDARPAARFAAGHIEGAIRLNLEDWETLWPAFLDAWTPGKPVVVYCDGGGCEASREVAERLRQEMPEESIFVLKGGWPAWQRR